MAPHGRIARRGCHDRAAPDGRLLGVFPVGVRAAVPSRVMRIVDQLAARANVRVLFGAEVSAVHGDTSLEVIDVRDRSTGAVTSRPSGGLVIVIGADAQTDWLPDDIALDAEGFVLTRSGMRTTGSAASRPATPRRKTGSPVASRLARAGGAPHPMTPHERS